MKISVTKIITAKISFSNGHIVPCDVVNFVS